MERLSCDVVVIGGGTAGCVVAGRLAAESEAEVVVLEAGPDYGRRDSGRWPADLLDGGALVASHSWGYDTGDLHPGRGPVELPRARVIGGCSAHSGCVAAVRCVEDYDNWARIAGDDRWSADALRLLFVRALERLRVRHYAEDEVGPFHRACLEAAAALGMPRADDLGDLDGGVGFGIEPVNVQSGVRVNTAFAYLDPARSRPNLRVVDRALCDRRVPGRKGVEVVARRDGGELRVHGQVAVLAAGAYGSPAILLRSGVGDPGAFAQHGIVVAHQLDGVGRNLHDHPLVELDFVVGTKRLRTALAEAAAERFVPEEQTLGKVRSSRTNGPYDLHLVPVAAAEHSLLAGRTILAVGAMEPRSRGRLTLASADPEIAPVMDQRLPLRPARRRRPARGDRASARARGHRAAPLARRRRARPGNGRGPRGCNPSDARPLLPPGRDLRPRARGRPARGVRRARTAARSRPDRRRGLLADAGRAAREHECSGRRRRRADRR